MKKLLRIIKRILNKLFGTTSDLLFWRFRHIFDKKWAEKYISQESLNHPHRKMLIEKISAYAPFESVLEVGCASGPNLILLAQKLPDAKLEGIDVSAKAIETGRKYLKLQNIKNVKLETGNILDLKKFADKSFDIVFTDAALIYVDKNKIEGVIKELIRLARKTVILNEWHTETSDSLYCDHWIHNYRKLFNKLIPSAEVRLTKIPEKIWPGEWAKYGYIVEISLN